MGDINSHGRRVLPSAVPWCSFPAVRRQLQHPRPTADLSVTFFAKTHFANIVLAVTGEYL
jgi:hypothetical protein